MKRVTIKDVANRAGVSAAAVSRVFTRRVGSSSAMREKVTRVAKELGYRPSMLAKGLVGERTNLITLVAGKMADPFDALFLDGFSASLAAKNMRLLLVSALVDGDDTSGFLHALDYQSDAVVVSAGTMSLEHSEACVKNGLPVILMGRVVDQFGVDCVIADNPNGARMAAELLLRTGCTNLAYLGRGGATYSDRERRDGFLATVAAAGVSASCHAVFGGIDDKVLFAAATTLLSGANRPDAVFCGNDSLAFAVIEAARSLGISIPADLSIVGFNNVPQAGWRSFNLTTIDLPVTACISMAMQLLSRRPGGEEYAPEVCRIPVELVVRGTTRQRPVGGRV